MNVYAKIAIVVALLAAVGGVMAYKLTADKAPGDRSCFTCPPVVATAPAECAGANVGGCGRTEAGCGGNCDPGGCGRTTSQPVVATDAPVVLPRLVEYGAGKCMACKQMAPIIAKIETDLAGRLTVESVDVFIDREAAAAAEIRVIPCQVFYAPDGTELFRHEGFFSEADILAKWKELGHDLTGSKP